MLIANARNYSTRSSDGVSGDRGDLSARSRVHPAQSPQYPHDDEIEHDAGGECDQQKLFHLSTQHTNKLSVAWWIRTLNKRLNGRVTWYACGHSGALTEAELAAAEVELKALQRHAFGIVEPESR